MGLSSPVFGFCLHEVSAGAEEREELRSTPQSWGRKSVRELDQEQSHRVEEARGQRGRVQEGAGGARHGKWEGLREGGTCCTC